MDYFRAIDNYAKLDARTGRVTINAWRRQVLPSFLYFDLQDGAVTINAVGGAVTAPVAFKQKYFSTGGMDEGVGTPFEIKNIWMDDSGEYTNSNYSIELRDLGEMRKFMPRPVHIKTLAGFSSASALGANLMDSYPARLREPYMFFSQHQIQVLYAALSGGPYTARLFLEGAQYYPYALLQSPSKARMVEHLKQWEQRKRYVWPYWLTTDEDVSVGANASVDAQMTIGGDAHFEAFQWAAVSTGDFWFEATNPRTGQTIMNGKVHSTAGVGTSQLPTILPVSWLLPKSDAIRFTFTDLSGSTNQIWFTIAGRMINAPLKEVPQVLQDTRVK